MIHSLIELLNSWGPKFLSYAGALLWQSSILIVILVVADLALRKKVAPSVRYALWSIVVIKLLLPPSLALPTNPAWWLRSPSAAPLAPARFVVITRAASGNPTTAPIPLPKTESPAAHLSLAAWMLFLASSVTCSLMAIAFTRSQGLRRLADNAEDVSSTPSIGSGLSLADIERLLLASARDLGLRRHVRLLLTDKPLSPAVYGLLRPVIILPRVLLANISPEQLRIVFLHELLHVRHGDVWINLLQTILQFCFWWHPLLWLANARIRILREQAVDEAVMHALGAASDAYPNALLHVAKLTLRQIPMLRLIGIIETKSALARRIERLLSFAPRSRIKFSLLVGVAILAFAGVAIPMGERPAPGSTAARGIPRQTSLSTDRSQEAAFDAAQPVLGEAILSPVATNLNLAPGRLDSNRPVATTNSAAPPPRIVVQLAGSTANTAVDSSAASPPQITIQAQFAEVSPETLAHFELKWFSHSIDPALKRQLGTIPSSNSPGYGAVLLPNALAETLRTLMNDPGSRLVNEMSVTTLSGRQCQIQSVEMQTVVMGINTQALTAPGAKEVALDTSTLPMGPTLDVTPTLRDGDSLIELALSANTIEFLGYDKPSEKAHVYVAGKKQDVTIPLPHFRVQTISQNAVLQDGQTLVLGTDECSSITSDGFGHSKTKSETAPKGLLVFITPHLVDAAGNPIHR